MSTSPTAHALPPELSAWLRSLPPEEQKELSAHLRKLPPEKQVQQMSALKAASERMAAINPNPKPLEDGIVSETPF